MSESPAPLTGPGHRGHTGEGVAIRRDTHRAASRAGRPDQDALPYAAAGSRPPIPRP
ncbi:hypothetical protein [Amycolatopsis antarctica]|nr:hypothetical protein [Amycolatopsis antarctica]